MSHHVLLVDDNDADRAVYRAMLLEEDPALAIQEASDAADAIRLMRSRRYDCVFLDVAMPGGDGFSVLAAVRSTNRSPIVMLTGVDDAVVAVRALREGAVDYLVKDGLTARQLTEALQQAVMHRLQLQAREKNRRRLALLQALLLLSEELILIVDLSTHTLIEAGTVGLARIGVRRGDVIDRDVRTLSLFGPGGWSAFFEAASQGPATLPTAIPGVTLEARTQQLTVDGTEYFIALARTVVA